jgi:hypothetical protein
MLKSVSRTFDDWCRLALERTDDTSAPARELIVEDLRLRFEYPDEYVAYIDRYSGKGSSRRLSREILGHSKDLTCLQAAVEACPDNDLARVVLLYAEPLDMPVSILHGLAGR